MSRTRSTPRVLVLGSGHDDFLVDGLVHGLRRLLGPDAVELPRIDHLYRDAPAERLRELHGMGFTLAHLLDDDREVDRSRAVYRAAGRAFDLVVFGDIWRSFGQWVQWMPPLRAAGVRLAVIDSGDRVEPYPYAGTWWRVRQWWALPRIRGRAAHFKREVTPATGWFRTYLAVPGPLAERIGATRDLRPISFAIPEELIVTTPPAKTKDWPAHVVDPEVAARVGARTGYAFADADGYHGDLRTSRYGVTTKKAGWDALRHYEIAAAGTVPCFRSLGTKPPRSAPYGLVAGRNCLAYEDAGDLLAQVERIGEAKYAELQAGALAWARANTTTRRARELLRECVPDLVGA